MDANSLLKDNQRLRKDVANYQNALESMELRAKSAEATVRDLARRLSKLSKAVTTAVVAAGGSEDEPEVPR